jgi:pimeloyl-ACP methyl ester carboxylesterase
MTASQFGKGVYQSVDGQIIHKGRLARWDGTQRLVVCCHGRAPAALNGQSCLQFAQNAGGAGPHLLALAERGYAVMGIDAGGQLTWGNQTSTAAVTNALAWARDAARGFAHPTKPAVLLGYSMGGAVATNYANLHPENVAALILEAPGVDIGYFHANGYAAEIDTAYPAGYTGRDPMTFAGALEMPTRIYTALDDPVVPNAVPHAFYDALGAADKAIIDLPTGQHTDFWRYMDVQALGDWLDGLAF